MADTQNHHASFSWAKLIGVLALGLMLGNGLRLASTSPSTSGPSGSEAGQKGTAEIDETAALSGPRFVDMTAASGLRGEHHPMPGSRAGEGYRRDIFTAGAGIACGDADGDGLLDLYLPDQAGANVLYRNLGGLRFEDVSDASGAAASDGTWAAAAFADLDRDGDQDLVLAGYRPTWTVLENTGKGRFVHRAGASATDAELAPAVTKPKPVRPLLALADGDNDGLIDLLVGEAGGAVFMRNEGGMRFSPAEGSFGIPAGTVVSSAALVDLDEKAPPDLFLGVPKGRDRLLVGSPSGFEDATAQTVEVNSWGTTGVSPLDFDRDGHLDLLTADLYSDLFIEPRQSLDQIIPTLRHAKVKTAEDREKSHRMVFGNVMQRHGVGHRWQDHARSLAIEGLFPWGMAVSDFDLDGNDEIFMASGMGWPWPYVQDTYYRRLDDGRWEEAAALVGLIPKAEQREVGPVVMVRRGAWAGRVPDRAPPLASRAAVACDLDEDGDADLVVRRWGAPVSLFENRMPPDDQRVLVLSLRGRAANPDAVGAVARLEVDGSQRVAMVPGTTGHLSAPDRRLRFGLTPEAKIGALEIQWPDGSSEQLRPQLSDAGVTLREIVQKP